MNKDELLERLTDFSVRVIKMSRLLPRDPAGSVIAKQIVASATSIAANIEEAIGATSRRDFLHKYSIARKEARETLRWLIIIDRAELIPHERLELLLGEANEIVAILTQSIKTAQGRTREGNAK